MEKSSIIIQISEKMTQLSAFGIDIQFEWIPALCELHGNERADSLSKPATQKEHIDVTVPWKRSELTNHIFQQL